MVSLRLSLVFIVNIKYYDTRHITHIRNTVIKLPFMADRCAAVVGCHYLLYEKEWLKCLIVKLRESS